MPAWCTFEIKVPPMALIPRRCSFCTMLRSESMLCDEGILSPKSLVPA